jgi:ribonuclease HI
MKPATRVYKLNIDAAFDPNSGRGATGAIIRDSGGNFIADACDHAMEVAAMEASALLLDTKLAEQFGAQSLMVESDSMEVVGAVLNPTENRGSYAAIIDDCRLLLEELEKQMRPHICLLDTTLCRVQGISGEARVFSHWVQVPCLPI